MFGVVTIVSFRVALLLCTVLAAVALLYTMLGVVGMLSAAVAVSYTGLGAVGMSSSI